MFASSLNYPLPSSLSYLLNEEKLKKPNIPLPASFLLFVPIASHTSKLLPEKHWVSLLEKAKELNLPILIPSGSKEEEARARRLASREEIVPLPRLSLSEIGYIVKHAKAVVSVDTGISHIAAALGTPAVTLYGPTDPKRTGTLGEKQTWISKEKIEEITPDEILRELIHHLDSNNKHPSN